MYSDGFVIFGVTQFHGLAHRIARVNLAQWDIPLIELGFPGRRIDHEVTVADSEGGLRVVVPLPAELQSDTGNKIGFGGNSRRTDANSKCSLVGQPIPELDDQPLPSREHGDVVGLLRHFGTSLRGCPRVDRPAESSRWPARLASFCVLVVSASPPDCCPDHLSACRESGDSCALVLGLFVRHIEACGNCARRRPFRRNAPVQHFGTLTTHRGSIQCVAIQFEVVGVLAG